MPNIGDTVTVVGFNWIILDKNENAILCFSKESFGSVRFNDETNNYAESHIRDECKGIEQYITSNIGKENLFDVSIDLTTLDGLDDYGSVTDKVGLLTLDMYRQYNHIIDKCNIRLSWWLATAGSTSYRDEDDYCCYVNNNGKILTGFCGRNRQLYPFVVFKKSVFE